MSAGPAPRGPAEGVPVKDSPRLIEIGKAEDCRETVWAISIQRRLTHPAVQAIIEANRTLMA